MTTGWQTAEHPEEGIRLRDEAEHVLFFLTDVLYRMMPPFYESLESALAATFPGCAQCACRQIVQFGSWVGGDMDGNPHVTAKSIRETLARQRSLVLDLYYRECAGARGPPEPRRQPRRACPKISSGEAQLYAGHFQEAASSLPARHRQMPYRAFLRLVGARLQATYADAAFPYESPDEFIADLDLIADSLRANKGRNAGLFARTAAAAPRADVRLPHRRARHSPERARASARDRRGAARERLARARQRRAHAPARRGARAARVADRRARRPKAGARSRSSRRSRTAGASTAATRSDRYIVSMAHGADDVLSRAAAREMGPPRAERRGRAARHRAAVRDRRGRRARARDHGQAARRPALSRASRRARQPADRDARLLGQPSRRRLRRGALEPAQGAGSARRDGREATASSSRCSTAAARR